MRIEDGKGRGLYVAVDENNKLNVASVSTPIISYASQTGDAYSVFGEHTLQAADTDENVLFLRNDRSNSNLFFQSVRISAKTSTGIVAKNMFGASYTSGGTAKVPVQLNRSSSKSSGMFCRSNASNDLVVTTTLLEEFARFRIGTTNTLLALPEGAVILGPGDNFLLRAQGAIGNIVNVSLFFFEVIQTGY